MRAAAILAVLALCVAGGAQQTWASTESSARQASPLADQQERTFLFDLPRMPLADALIRYGEITDRSVLYETGQVAGRHAPALKGRFTQNDALSRLLADSGLRARALSARSVTVAPIPDTTRSKPTAVQARLERQRRHYDGYLQRAVFQALCADSALQADQQRIVLRFSVNAQRRVEGLRVHMASNPELESVVHRVLSAQHLDAPPSGVEQPVLMLISPDAARRWGGCPQ